MEVAKNLPRISEDFLNISLNKNNITLYLEDTTKHLDFSCKTIQYMHVTRCCTNILYAFQFDL